jgi:hypothetical protein
MGASGGSSACGVGWSLQVAWRARDLSAVTIYYAWRVSDWRSTRAAVITSVRR